MPRQVIARQSVARATGKGNNTEATPVKTAIAGYSRESTRSPPHRSAMKPPTGREKLPASAQAAAAQPASTRDNPSWSKKKMLRYLLRPTNPAKEIAYSAQNR